MSKMQKKISSNEKKTAAASYFYTFYTEITKLNHYEAQYRNIIIELRSKYVGLKLENIKEDERAVLNEQVQHVRYHARQCWIMYNTIIPALKLTQDQEVKEAYQQIESDYIIKIDHLEQYVIGLNSILVNNIIQELLDTSQELIENIYQEDEPTTPN